MFALTPAVRNILIATTAAFFLQLTLGRALDEWLAWFPPAVLVRPWTLVTYALLHSGLGHFFFNMLGLFFFGPRVEERIGTRNFYALYVIAAVVGALFGFFFPFARLVGASGAVYGVMLAFARFWPREPIHIWGILPVPAAVLVLAYAVISVLSFNSSSGTAHWAHLGGFAGGFLFLKWLDRGRGTWKKKVTAAPKVDRDVSRYKQVDRSNMHALNREELDRILDKINATGVGSLTAQERIFLSNFTPKDDRPPVS